MPDPLYVYERLKPSFQLRYTWTGWPTAGTNFPPCPNNNFFVDLHLVLVVASRRRIRSEQEFVRLDRSVQATAKKHSYKLAVRAWMPDHFHVALRGNVEQSPGEIALSMMNNTAFVMGQNAIWQQGFYAGSFSEYDVRAVAGGGDFANRPDKPAGVRS